jgi:TP901 family phage tail tape measure protein
MAKPFNLTAEINLRGPSNIGPIVSNIKKQLGNINANINLDIKNGTAKKIEAITQKITALSTAATNANGSITTLNNSLQQLNSAYSNLSKGTGSTQQNLANINNTVANSSKSISVATTKIEEFGRQSALAIKRFAAFSVVTGGIYSLTSAINSASKEFVDFDRQMVTLAQVTNSSKESLTSISGEITRLATNLGVSSSELLIASLTLAQAGLSANDTQMALEALAKSALAPSFDDMTQTVEGSIAAMRQFDIGADQLESTLGSINAVAAAFAVESQDIIQAIQRTGGVFASSSKGISQGTDALNEFVALFTSVRATTRESAETIATGLRTIFTRIQRGSTIEFLKQFGIQLTDLNNKFVGPYEAVRRLSDGLSSLDTRDIRFSKIVEELGGFRQISKVIPLLQQFASAEEALSVAQKGQKSLTVDAATAQQSLAVQFNKTRESFLALVRDVGDSGVFRALTTTTLTLANGFIQAGSALKPLLPLLTALAVIKGGSALTQFATGFSGGLGSGGTSGPGGGPSLGQPSPNQPTGGSSGSGGQPGATAQVNALSSNTTAIMANVNALNALSSLINPLTTAIQNLNISSIQSSSPGPTTTLNSGGMVRKFATGGVVPGSGNSDTVPAMLTPGEFVIRKQAAQAIGANNLHSINKYNGGYIKPQKFREGNIVEASTDTQESHFGSILELSPEDIRRAILKTRDKKIAFAISDTLSNSSVGGGNIVDSLHEYIQTLDSQGIKTLSDSINLEAKKGIKLTIPRTFNQALRRNDPDLVAQQDLIDWTLNNSKITKSLPKNINIDNRDIASRISLATPRQNKDGVLAYDVDEELFPVGDSISQQFAVKAVDFMFSGASRDFYKKIGLNPERARAQDRFSISNFIDGGWVKRMQQQPTKNLKDELGLLDSTLDLFGFQKKVPISTFSKSAPFMEDAGVKEVKERIGSIKEFLATKEPQKKAVEKKITLPKAPPDISDHLKSLITENETYEITKGVYGGVVREALNRAYKGDLGPGKQQSMDKVGPKSIVSYNPDRKYIDAPLGVLENDIKYIDKVKSLEVRDTENLTANKGYSVSDMLDTVRAYQAIGLDGAINTALGRKEDLSQSLGDFSGLNKTERKRLGPGVEKPLSFFAESLDAAMQFSLPEKLYSGIGASKQKLFIESAGVKVNKLEDTKKLVGKTVSIPSFLSTSEVPATAESFARTGMMTIETNKKAKGLNPERAKTDTINRDKSKIRKMEQRLISDSFGKGKADENYADDYDIESEYILPRNSQFKVKNIEANDNSIEGSNILESLNMDWAVKMLNRGGKVQNFMAGGAATKTRKPKEIFGTGETPFPSRISKKYAEEQHSASENLRAKLAWDRYPKDERIMVDDQKVQEAYQQPFDRNRFASSFKEKISRDSLFERMSDFAKFVGLPQEDLSKTLPLQLDFGGSKRGGGLGMFAAAQFEKGATGIRPYEGYDLSKSGYGEKQKQEAYGLEKLITAKEKEIAKIRKTPTETFDDGSFSFDREAYSKANDELAEFKNRSFKLKDLKRDAEKAALAEQSATSSAAGRGTISFASSMGYSSDTKNSTLYHEMTHQLFQGLRTKSAGSFDKYRDRVSSLFSGDNDDLADAFDSLTAGDGYSSADVVYGRSYKSNNLSQILSSYYRQNLDFSRGTTTIPQDITKNLASLSNQSTAAKRARDYRPINPKVNEALLQAGDKFGMTQEKINRMEDNGKEEFLTTLMENAPKLDGRLQPILDSTLTELLSGAGIQRQKYATGGVVQKFADGGVARRRVGYIDYDVIANPANEAIIKKGMEITGVDGPRLYTDHLTDLAIKARKERNLDKLRAIYGVAGSGKTTLARGQGTDSAKLRQTERFPILTPEDVQRATEVTVLSSSVSKDKLDNLFSATDRTYTLSSTTQEEKNKIKSQRASRDVTGIGLEGRKPGVTSGVAYDTATGEALLQDRLGSKSVVLGRTNDNRLRVKRGDELVNVIKKKIGFAWGGFAPMTAGHESIMDAAAAMGYSPEDFIYLVGSNEGIKPGDPSSYRTAVFDQDFRMVLAKAGAGSRGATVLPKPRDFEVPQAFDMTQESDTRRTVLVPQKGSRTFVADKTAEQTKKYKEAGYQVTHLERTGGISGTMVRDLIMSGDTGKLQEVLSPGVYDIISNNIGRLQNRANILPSIIEQVKATQGVKITDIENQIKALGIARIDSKRVSSDPEYAAKVEVLQELRNKKDKIKSAASFEPYRILDQMAMKEPDKYGLDFSMPSSRSEAKPIRTMGSNKRTQKAAYGGLIQKFASGGLAAGQSKDIDSIFNNSDTKRRLVFDLDNTLIDSDESIFYNDKQKFDTSLLSNLDLVQKGLSTAKLTPLGLALKQKAEQKSLDIEKDVRILTARPSNNVELIGQALRKLGINVKDNQITGVAGSQNKVKNLEQFDTLIDDKLDVIDTVRKAGYSGIGYIPQTLSTYATGGQVGTEQSDLLEKYKKILASILPSEMLTKDGFLKTPDGRGESIDIQTSGDKAFYAGGLPFKAIRHQIEKAKPQLPQQDYDVLKRFIDQNLLFEGNEDIINVGGAKHRGVLAHETFHDIQGYLYDNYPDIADKIFQSINNNKPAITQWYSDTNNAEYTGPGEYQLGDFFPNLTSGALAGSGEQRNIGKDVAVSGFKALQKAKAEASRNTLMALGKGSFDVGRNETIPVLLGAAAEGNSPAAKILEQIFAEAGLKSDFYKTLPKFADGGQVGAVVDSNQKEKQYGKISIIEDGNMLNAGYIKNDKRSGYATAYKMRDYLYYVGLSSATGGYGPRLYDVLMEMATEKGAMLTSDRSMVSGDAKRVWEYYFNNRSDVKKTPLKPSDWTRNEALIDPKLYGKEETWPPADDPVWTLQTGYSKSPNIINSPDIIRSNQKMNSGAVMASFFAANRPAFATGGSVGESVPALLTPGEAVIGPKLAKKIGYGKLNQMNHADKKGVSKFASGGNVSIVPGSGNSDTFGPVPLEVGSFVIRKKATQALGFNKGGVVQKFVDGGWVERMQKQKKSVLTEDLKYLQSAMLFAEDTGAYVPTYKTPIEKEAVSTQEVLDRYNAMFQFVNKKLIKGDGLKPSGGYNEQELLDAITYYQGGSGPLSRAMVNNDFIMIDRNEQYDTEDLVNRLTSASQFSLPKKLYSGFGRGQFNEILKDTNIQPDQLIRETSKTLQSLVGKVVDFPTFLSTSVNKDIAQSFIGDPGALVSIDASKTKSSGIDILKAKGKTSVDPSLPSRRLPGLEKIKQTKLAGYDQEKEFVLQPNAKFKILKASGFVAEDLQDKLTGIKKQKVEKTQTLMSDAGEEFVVSEPDYEYADSISKFKDKTKLDIQTQMLNRGGKIARFMAGGLVENLAESKGVSPEQELISQISALGGIKGVKRILGQGGGDRTLDSLLRAGNIKSGVNLEQALSVVNSALSAQGKGDAAENERLSKLTKVAVVGLLDASGNLGYNKDFEWDIGDNRNVYATVRGLPQKYAEAALQMQQEAATASAKLAENIQYADIFGGGEPLVFDFDKTLVDGADILGPDGKPDITKYYDRNSVGKALKDARLTKLGTKLKSLIDINPDFIKNTRILTARPQETADLLSRALQTLGLPYDTSNITGVGKGIGSNIANEKASNLAQMEKLVDDSLDNVQTAQKSGKQAYLYNEPMTPSSQLDELMGQGNIEGAIIEKALATLLGYNLDVSSLEQNRAIDFPDGLGYGARFFGVDPTIPTEVKRTLDGSSFEKARAEFARFYTENPDRFNLGGFVQKFANGGLSEDTVPALLTPGEFVINRQAAQKIGYQKLHKLNKADKIKGYNTGGIVGSISRYAGGGEVVDDSVVQIISDRINEAAQKIYDSSQELGQAASEFFSKNKVELSYGSTIDQLYSVLNKTMGKAASGSTSQETAEAIRGVLSKGFAVIRDMERQKSPLIKENSTVTQARNIRVAAEETGADVMQAITGTLGKPQPLNIQQPKMDADQKTFDFGDVITPVLGDNLDQALQQLTQKTFSFMQGPPQDQKTKQTTFAFDNDYKSIFDKLQAYGSSAFDKLSKVSGSKVGLPGNADIAGIVKAFPLLNKLIPDAASEIGILSTVLSVGTSMIGQNVPKLGEAIDNMTGSMLSTNPAFAAFGKALEAGGSQAATGAVLGRRAFGKGGDLALGGLMGSLGAIGGATQGYIQKDNENRLRASSAALKEFEQALENLSQETSNRDRAEAYKETIDDLEAYRATLGTVRDNMTATFGNRMAGAIDTFLTTLNLSVTALIAFQAATAAAATAQAVSGVVGAVGTVGSVAGAKAGYKGGLVGVSYAAAGNIVGGGGAMSQPVLTSYEPKGADKYPYMLAAGEFVVNAKSSKKNSRLLQNINSNPNTSYEDSMYAQYGGLITATGAKNGGKVSIAHAQYADGGLSVAAILTIGAAVVTTASTLMSFFRTDLSDVQKQNIEALTKNTEALRLVAESPAFQERGPDSFYNREIAPQMREIETSGLPLADRESLYAQFEGPLSALNIATDTSRRTALEGAGVDVPIDSSVFDFLESLKDADPAKYTQAMEAVQKADKEMIDEMYVSRRRRQGASLDVIKKELNSKDDAEILAEAQKEIGRKNRQQLKQIEKLKLGDELQIATADIKDVMKAFVNQLEIIKSQSEASIIKTDTVIAALTGPKATAMGADQRRVDVLSNTYGASRSELTSVVDNIVKEMGGGEDATKMGSLTKGLQVMQKEIPIILRSMTGDIDDGSVEVVREKLKSAFEGLDINESIRDDLIKNFTDFLNKPNRKGKSYEDMASDGEVLNDFSKVAEQARGTLEKYARAELENRQKLIQRTNELIGIFGELSNNTVKINSLQAKSINDMEKQLGRQPSLAARQAASDMQISTRTGGITDPTAIANKINEMITEKTKLEATPESQRNNLLNNSIGKLTNNINQFQLALQELSTSSDLATVALDKISERQQVLGGQRSGVMNMFGMINQPEQLLDFIMQQRSYSRVLQGTGNINDVARGTQVMSQVQATSTPEEFMNIQRKYFDSSLDILRRSGVDEDVLDQFKSTFKGAFNTTQDPQVASFINAYQAAIDRQTKAIEASSGLLGISANTLTDNMVSISREFGNMADVLRQIRADFNQIAQRQANVVVPDAPPAVAADPAGGLAQGGIVYASLGSQIFAPKGTDTVPAMLTPGEFVVNRSATQKNLPLLKSINSGTSYLADGGVVGRDFEFEKMLYTKGGAGSFKDRFGNQYNYGQIRYAQFMDPLNKTVLSYRNATIPSIEPGTEFLTPSDADILSEGARQEALAKYRQLETKRTRVQLSDQESSDYQQTRLSLAKDYRAKLGLGNGKRFNEPSPPAFDRVTPDQYTQAQSQLSSLPPDIELNKLKEWSGLYLKSKGVIGADASVMLPEVVSQSIPEERLFFDKDKLMDIIKFTNIIKNEMRSSNSSDPNQRWLFAKNKLTNKIDSQDPTKKMLEADIDNYASSLGPMELIFGRTPKKSVFSPDLEKNVHDFATWSKYSDSDALLPDVDTLIKNFRDNPNELISIYKKEVGSAGRSSGSIGVAPGGSAIDFSKLTDSSDLSYISTQITKQVPYTKYFLSGLDNKPVNKFTDVRRQAAIDNLNKFNEQYPQYNNLGYETANEFITSADTVDRYGAWSKYNTDSEKYSMSQKQKELASAEKLLKDLNYDEMATQLGMDPNTEKQKILEAYNTKINNIKSRFNQFMGGIDPVKYTLFNPDAYRDINVLDNYDMTNSGRTLAGATQLPMGDLQSAVDVSIQKIYRDMAELYGVDKSHLENDKWKNYKDWIKKADLSKYKGYFGDTSVFGNPFNIDLDILDNLAQEKTLDINDPTKIFGLWSYQKSLKANGSSYVSKYANNLNSVLLSLLGNRGPQQAPEDVEGNLPKVAEALNKYTSDMSSNRSYISSSLKINKNLPDKQLIDAVRSQYNKYRSETIDKTFGRLDKNDLSQWNAIAPDWGYGDKKNPNGISLRNDVLADSASLDRIVRKKDKSVIDGIINGTYTTDSASSIMAIPTALKAGDITGVSTYTDAQKYGLASPGADPSTQEVATNRVPTGMRSFYYNMKDMLVDSLLFEPRRSYDARQNAITKVKDYSFIGNMPDGDMKTFIQNKGIEDQMDNALAQLGTDTYPLWDRLITAQKTAVDSWKLNSIDDGGMQQTLDGSPASFGGMWKDFSWRSYVDKLNTNKPQYDFIKDLLTYSSEKLPTWPVSVPYAIKQKQPLGLATGGQVPAYLNDGSLVNFAPRGTDTVPAMLTPGEFVVNRSATQKNLPLLKSLNSGSKGYSRGGVIYAAEGMHLDTDMSSDSPRRDKPDSSMSPTVEEIAPGVYGVDPRIWQSDAPKSMRSINLEDLERNKFNQDEPIPYTNVTWAELAYAVEETRKRQARQKTRENSNLAAFGIAGGEATLAHLAASQVAAVTASGMSPVAAAFPWGTAAYALTVPLAYGATYAAASFGINKVEKAIGVKDRFDEIKAANPYATTAGSILPLGAALTQAGVRAGASGIAREAGLLVSTNALKDRAIAAVTSGAADAGVQVLVNAGEMMVGNPDDPHTPKNIWELNTNQILAAMVGGATLGRAEIAEARQKWTAKLINQRQSARMPEGGQGGSGAFGYGPRPLTPEDTLLYEKAARSLIGDDVINRHMLQMAGVEGDDLVYSAIRAARKNNFPEQYTNTTQGETPLLSSRTLSGGGEGMSPRAGLSGARPEFMDPLRPDLDMGNIGQGFYNQEDVKRVITYLQGNIVSELKSGKSLSDTLNNVSVLSSTLSPETKLLVQNATKNFENQPISQDLLDKLNANLSKFSPGEPPIPTGTIQEKALNTYLERYRRIQIEDPIVGAAMPTMEQVVPVRVAYPNKIDPLQNKDLFPFRGISGELQRSGLDIAFSSPDAFIKMQETRLQTLFHAAHQGDQAVASMAADMHGSMMAAIETYIHRSGLNEHHAEGSKVEHAKGHQTGGLIYANNGRLINFQPRGTDTVPAMLTPGEFVVNREATSKHLNLLQNINRGSSIASQYASQGGMIPQYLARGSRGPVGGGGSGGMVIDTSRMENVFNSFTTNFQSGIQNLSGIIDKLGRELFPAMSGPISSFANSVDALKNLKLEISVPNIPSKIDFVAQGTTNIVVDIRGDIITEVNKLSEGIQNKVYNQVADAVNRAFENPSLMRIRET